MPDSDNDTRAAEQVGKLVVVRFDHEIQSVADVHTVAAELRKITQVAVFADALAVQLRAQIIGQLRNEGMVGGGGLLAAILGTDEIRAANAVVAPLRAIATDADNIGRNAHRLVSRMHERFINPVKEARAQAKGQRRGLVID